MVNPESPSNSCDYPKTNIEKSSPYIQYYTGEKDQHQRKNGYGRNCWTGAKSLECYSGHLIRDTMHGEGDYQWRYLGPKGAFGTYEGNFFNNQLHGYGVISYDDGRVFNGIFHGNIRWGPGIESHACVKNDVGLWSGRQLIRLCWRPYGPSVAPDFMSTHLGKEIVKPHRRILSTSVKTLGEVNSALEVLKQLGANPLSANNNWSKLYPEHCTDLSSALCNIEIFEKEYYNGKIYTLKEYIEVTKDGEVKPAIDATTNAFKIHLSEDSKDVGNFYAWNSNDVIKHMMMHCYKHEFQRKLSNIDLELILSGPRKRFKPAGQHEIDSRTLLLASYLGHTSQVTQLINVNNVHPDVSDMLGNTALIYATSGERTDIIHFLVEAGANVNSYNDSCCTPLGVALINLACTANDILPNDYLPALLPPYLPPKNTSTEMIVSEWFILRESQLPVIATLAKSPSKGKNLSSKKIISVTSLKDQTVGKKKTESSPPKVPEQPSDESFSEDKRVYMNIYREFSIKADEIKKSPGANNVTYLFEINDMILEVDASEEEQKKLHDKSPKKIMSKTLKEATKASKVTMWQSEKDESSSANIVEKLKKDRLTKIIATLFQLLSDGADPKLVTCPQPALYLAVVSGSTEVVRHLIFNGANVNEVYPMVLDYMPLDIAISQPFTKNNLDLIRTLLENGADTQHRLVYDSRNELAFKIMGPTLLHAVLARKTENESEEEIKHLLLEMLLDYNCNPTIQFKGRSAIDISMSKSMDLFDIFIKHPNTNLNSTINGLNQNVLLKMFYLPYFKTITGTERLPKITDLLLFGANPLVECQDGKVTYENIFVFAKKTLSEMEGNQPKSASLTIPAKKESRTKKVDAKGKKDDKIMTKPTGRMIDEIGDYKQALSLVTDCARLLHIRWLQANLVKKLIAIIKKYSHRHWHMILKEIENKKNVGLWLTAQRCIDIWNILTSDKQESYGDRHILKYLVNIAQFCVDRVTNGNSLKTPLTYAEKGIIEKKASHEMQDKYTESLKSDIIWKRCYVKPELISEHTKMFHVCFECALPSSTNSIKCAYCKLVSFCSLECMQVNIDRTNCHPCSNMLKEKYFPNNSDNSTL